MRTKILAASVLLPLSCLAIHAQTADGHAHRLYVEQADYMDAAKEKAILYRGMFAPEYHFQSNGTFYAETKEFRKGEVFYNGSLYKDVLLNVDACAQLLVVKANLLYATDRDYVEYAVMGDSKFVNLQYGDQVKNAPLGFCKALYEGSCGFYKYIRKTILTSDGNHNGDDIGYDDPDYKEYAYAGTRAIRIQTFFAYGQKLYFVKDGVARQVKNRMSLLKCFDKETAKELRHYASRSKSIAACHSFEEVAVDLLRHYDSVRDDAAAAGNPGAAAAGNSGAAAVGKTGEEGRK